MNIQIVHVGPEGVGPYIRGLKALEREITYPLDDGNERFYIDHGARYAPFFSDMGEAHFLVALDGDRVVGTVTGVLKPATLGKTTLTTGYVCDLKVAQSHRGAGVAQRMLLFGIKEILKPQNGHYRSLRLLYAAAMRGERGDVRNSAKGLSPIKLVRPMAMLAIYFVDPKQLAELPKGAPVVNTRGLNMSPGETERLISTANKKDLRLVSTDAPWPLCHLPHGPDTWGEDLGAYLSSAGQRMLAQKEPGLACFSLDLRLGPQLVWLNKLGIKRGAICTVLGLHLNAALRGLPWVHLSTSEI